VQADLLKLDALPNLVKATVKEFGRLDALINNASSFYPTPVGEITEKAWDISSAPICGRRCSCRRPRARTQEGARLHRQHHRHPRRVSDEKTTSSTPRRKAGC